MTPDAIRQAHHLYATKDRLSRQQLVDEVVSQAEWDVWSNRHLATLSGLRPAFVNELTGKRDKTGGTINPSRLGDLADVAAARNRGEDVRARVAELAGDGFSSTMIARLTGIPVSSIGRWIG